MVIWCIRIFKVRRGWVLSVEDTLSEVGIEKNVTVDGGVESMGGDTTIVILSYRIHV